MLATPVPEIPTGEGMVYEPKWDGVRCIVFRDGAEVELASRGGKTLTRYFPEIVAQAIAQLPERSVVDGELIVIRHAERALPRLDFELLGQRIHPAASRVNMLAETTPASFIAFDLLALDGELLMEQPYASRRARLEEALAHVKAPVHVTPVSRDAETAREWFTVLEGAGLDGLIAKPADIPYVPGKRLMYKVKHSRTLDAVVAGFRYRKDAAKDHPWLWGTPTDRPDGEQRLPGGVSRWSGKKNLEWLPLRPELVVEVEYSAMEGDRIRHTAQFRRWRPDRTPRSCTYEQL